MRIKNFTLLFLMGIFGLFTTNLFAQQDATIDPENIRYWIGEGENQVVFIANWAEPDTALAWGYRFAGESVTIKDVMDGIAEVDYRFSYEASGSWLLDMHFKDDVLDLSLVEQMWVSYLVNGESSWDTYDVKTLVNNDYVKLGDTHCGTLIDPENYIYVWEKEVVAVYPLADEAMIDPSEILYWVGEGENEVIFAVNWAEPDVCYAWGYRFSTNDVLVKTVMDGIAAADDRFAYEVGSWGVGDITFNYGDLHLALVGPYWMYNINGGYAWYGYDEQAVGNGDFIKWGDVAVGTEIAPWTYVWETPVTPVANNTSVAENSTVSSLYPNPATSFTMLEVGMSNATVTVTDLQGRVLRSFAVDNDSEAVRIETEGFQAGLYFVTVSDGTNTQTLKLSVK